MACVNNYVVHFCIVTVDSRIVPKSVMSLMLLYIHTVTFFGH